MGTGALAFVCFSFFFNVFFVKSIRLTWPHHRQYFSQR